ncbi:DNA repair protein RecN [Myxococcota bacterium]|nr:DNA repair protein RecN [Myxococcota bacterium]
MLIELTIRNLAIVAEVSVRFAEGLNVLSGETGAGKSIILHGLGLLLGARASAELVRTGEEEAEVEGLFDPEPDLVERLVSLEIPAEAGDAVSIRRVVSSAGRSRAYVAGRAVPASVLRDLAPYLVDYAGQHEHHVLLDEARHLDLLDRYGGLAADRAAVASAVAALRAAEGALAEQLRREGERAQREDFLRFQWKELKDAAPRREERTELDAERLRLANAERLARDARAAEEALYSGGGSVVERLGEAVARVSSLRSIDPDLAALHDDLASALLAAEEGARALRDYARRVQHDPERLDRIQERLAELSGLARKHRVEVDGLADRLAELDAELTALDYAEERRASLEGEAKRLTGVAMGLAAALSARRGDAARRLTAAVEAELRDLAMPRARLAVVLERRGEGREALDPTGIDRASFHLSANPGEEPRPLARVASGGELSRVLLAVKRALAGASRVQTFVFDEIDAGIGGATAEVVGAKIRDISREDQVLCITHLPQIAACADAHYFVVKEEVGGRTRTRVERLQGEDRVLELARMVGGATVTGTSRELARELITRMQR